MLPQVYYFLLPLTIGDWECFFFAGQDRAGNLGGERGLWGERELEPGRIGPGGTSRVIPGTVFVSVCGLSET